ncbi:MAG: M48 family metallopeptidase [Paludibacter sp.]|nr:M48 family metallopeptidase [Paludibacter sp.]
MNTTGKYFDGKQSQPQQVEIVFDVDSDLLLIRNDQLSIQWPVTDINYEKIGSMLEIRIKEHSDEFLAVTDTEFNLAFIQHLHNTKNVGVYKKLLHLSFSKHLFIFAGLLTLLVLGYIFLVPFIAEKSVILIPQSFDKQIAKIALTDFGFETDSTKSVILNEFADNLELNNQVDLNFKVVESGIVNAYALPDGTIIVFTGLLDKMDNYEQLTGLIAHEVSHVNNRHAMKMLCRNLSGYIFVSALFSDINGIMAVIAENAHNLNTLTYSRKFENEADEEGTMILIQNGINPRGVISLFKMLQKEEKDYQTIIPEYISTHPYTKNRIENIEKIIKEQSFVEKKKPGLKRLFRELKL